MTTETKAGFLSSHHLMLSERLKDANRDLKGFDYRKAINQDGIESANLQLSRLEYSLCDARASIVVFYDESGTAAQDFE